MVTAPGVRLSVVVPAHNGGESLDACLRSLVASDLPRDVWQLIVVDDGSSDDTPRRAAAYADRVIRLEAPPRGPAYARNRGSEIAAGDVLAFIDADVCVHRSTLRNLLDALDTDARVDAVFGAYDTEPAARGTVSQYRNLLHHYVHARRAGEADTFWAGCGAIRRDAFHRVGGFDAATYPRPAIEDIALGYRMRRAGSRILLRPDIQATHLKRWTLRSMVRSDLVQRGVPWVRLLLEGQATGGGSLNVRPEERLLTALAGLAGVSLVAGTVAGQTALLLLSAGCVIIIVAANARMLAWFARLRGIGFALRVIPLRILYYGLNAVALGVGVLRHVAARMRRKPPRAETAGATHAGAEPGRLRAR